MKNSNVKSNKIKSYLTESDKLLLNKHKSVDINILLNRVRIENKKMKKKKFFFFIILGILGTTFFLINS